MMLLESNTRKNVEVTADVKKPRGQSKLQSYWTSGIYHHAVLDLEVKPWRGLPVQDEVRKAFDLLKALRAVQAQLNTSHPSAGAPHGGYIVLGVRIWPSNRVHFLGNVTEQMQQFAVDGFVPWTHFTEDEFEANYSDCVITGASPLTAVNNNYTMDMYQVMDWVNSSTTWNIHPSLAISVSMCTRVYLSSTGMDAKYGDACQYNNTPPGTSATLCEVKIRYKHLDISLALFDIECEDWQNECTSADSNVVQGWSLLNSTDPLVPDGFFGKKKGHTVLFLLPLRPSSVQA
ncbi:hypothetical protein HPB50_024236 [Hyalomma asiaticum]|uniref:Uncharacterized protein n=1 Tax=Hyalomma asiaticum TaxID=266040 RepID=A0ACB7SMT5_HYAAI|nr:hypothetical protein HPB50_024236 [Hyalomma asiaticum]